jgi:hypothetical protein
MSGSSNTYKNDATYVMYFHKDLCAKYGISDLYQTVKRGKWTLGYFAEAVQGGASDLNDDGKLDERDQYGFTASYGYANSFFIGSDLSCVDNSIEELSFQVNIDRMADVCDQVRLFYNEEGGSFIAPQGQEVQARNLFAAGATLFYGDVLLNRTVSEKEYGILPVPKYDAQQTYKSWSDPIASALAVPTTVANSYKAETVGKIVEGYAILSHETVKPAYYESVLRMRADRNTDEYEMLERILNNIVWDVAFTSTDTPAYDFFEESVKQRSPASMYKRIAVSMDRYLLQLFNAIH